MGSAHPSADLFELPQSLPALALQLVFWQHASSSRSIPLQDESPTAGKENSKRAKLEALASPVFTLVRRAPS